MMRRIFFIALSLMAWLGGVSAQVLQPSPQTVSVQDSGTACSVAGTCATWGLTANPTMTIQVVGTFSATLTFEATADGITWFALNATKLSTGAAATTTTTTGQYSVANTGLLGLRVRATTLASGGANLTLAVGTAASAFRFPSNLGPNGVTFTNGTQLNDTALGVLAMTSSGTVNGLRIPNGSNLEYGGINWSSNVLQFVFTPNGGTNQNVRFGTLATSGTVIFANNTDRFLLDASGNFTNNSTGVISSTSAPTVAQANSFFMGTVAFASLSATASNGTMIYCSDCTVTTAATCPATAASCICAGSGSGATARRVGGVWNCTP